MSIDRRGFLRGVIGTSAVALVPSLAKGVVLEEQKEILLPVTPQIVLEADSLRPPCAITSWEVKADNNVSYATLMGGSTFPRTQRCVINISMEAWSIDSDLELLVKLHMEGAKVTWALPYRHGTGHKEVIVTGLMHELSIQERTNQFTRIQLSLAGVADGNGAPLRF